jgi:beta-lactamase superfamily II metal-dependent hydrolase
MYDGLEIDVLNLGDADCIVVTKWTGLLPHRILIDGGCAKDADAVSDWLLSRNYRAFEAAFCTHAHNDHASGLIKLIQKRDLTISNGWVHDITKHVNDDALRRAANADDGVRQVVETTKELVAAFGNRNIPTYEPFAQQGVVDWPELSLLGPSVDFYQKKIREFSSVSASVFTSHSWEAAAIPFLGNRLNYPPYVFSPIPLPLTGALMNSSVKENPRTQPYNNTSLILGLRHQSTKCLLTADAGSEALAFVSSEWNHLAMCTVPHHGSEGNFSQRDMERFCPTYAYISAKGDSCHPSRAIVSGLVKVGANVASTHQSGSLWFSSGRVPIRSDYGPLKYLTGTGSPAPVYDLLGTLSRR